MPRSGVVRLPDDHYLAIGLQTNTYRPTVVEGAGYPPPCPKRRVQCSVLRIASQYLCQTVVITADSNDPSQAILDHGINIC